MSHLQSCLSVLFSLQCSSLLLSLSNAQSSMAKALKAKPPSFTTTIMVVNLPLFSPSLSLSLSLSLSHGGRTHDYQY